MTVKELLKEIVLKNGSQQQVMIANSFIYADHEAGHLLAIADNRGWGEMDAIKVVRRNDILIKIPELETEEQEQEDEEQEDE